MNWARCGWTSRQPSLWNEILDYTKTKPFQGEDVLALPYFPLYYYMSGRDHPSRFMDLRPGSPGTESEEEFIGVLERDETRYILYALGLQYPGIDRFENAYPRLHHYIETHYEQDRSFMGSYGSYADILRRSR